MFGLLTGLHKAEVGMCCTVLGGSIRLPEGSSARQLMSYVVTIEGVMTLWHIKQYSLQVSQDLSQNISHGNASATDLMWLLHGKLLPTKILCSALFLLSLVFCLFVLVGFLLREQKNQTNVQKSLINIHFVRCVGRWQPFCLVHDSI